MKASASVLCLALLVCAACTSPAAPTPPETTQPVTAAAIPTTTALEPAPSPSATPQPTRTCTPTPRMSPRPTPFSIPVQATAVWSWEPGNYPTAALTDGLVLLDVVTRVVILDTADLGRPQQLWQSGDLGRVRAIALAGRRAYVLAGEDLLLWDLTDPARPGELGRVTVPPGWTRVVPAGNVVHVITGMPDKAAVMSTFDFSDPAAPQERTATQLPRFPHGLALVGGYGYALYDGYLEIFDLTSPPTATSLSTISLTTSINSQIQIAGGRAYVATHDGLYILDVVEPTAPREIGYYRTDMAVSSARVIGTRAYLTCQLCGWEPDENGEPVGGCGQGVHVIDLEDVGRPRLLGSYAITMGGNQEWIDYSQLAGRTLYLLTHQTLYAADLGPLP